MNIFGEESGSKLIGIAGTLGAGKDTLAEHLVKTKGFLHVSTGDVLRVEATARGLDPTHRPTLIEIGIELRATHGMGALSLKGAEQWQERRDEFAGGLVVSGIRILGEATGIQDQGGTVVFVDGPAEIRYKNIMQKRGRAEGTFNTYEEFIEYEAKEMYGLLGPDSPNLSAIRGIADVHLWNSGKEEDKHLYLRDGVRDLGLAA